MPHRKRDQVPFRKSRKWDLVPFPSAGSVGPYRAMQKFESAAGQVLNYLRILEVNPRQPFGAGLATTLPQVVYCLRGETGGVFVEGIGRSGNASDPMPWFRHFPLASSARAGIGYAKSTALAGRGSTEDIRKSFILASSWSARRRFGVSGGSTNGSGGVGPAFPFRRRIAVGSHVGV